MKIDFDAFLETLPYAGKGMLGIFIVIGILILCIVCMNLISRVITKSKAKKQK